VNAQADHASHKDMSQSNAAHSDPLIGARVGDRYTIKGVLGQGGMGVVYDGMHDELQRPVAIKVLNTLWATDQTAVQRFLREARTASSFSHGNIVDVTDLGRLPDGRPYLVMPKVPGIDLATLLHESGPQPAKRVGELLRGAASALDLIHARGYVHRDIKPENLMYCAREDGSETVMLLDFGIAAALMSNERRLTTQGQVFGTPHYMAPEAATGALTDARGDVYALATVAFELITGSLPFDAENVMQVLSMKLVTEPPTLAQASGQHFPEQLEAVIACGLARDPAARYSTAGELVNAIALATEHAPVSWRSGVLRPTQRSDAHPVTTPRQAGSEPWPGVASARSSRHSRSNPSQRSGSGREQDDARAAHGGHGSGWVAPSAYREPSRGWQNEPQAGWREPTWQQQHEPTMELGAGLRESERMSQRALMPRERAMTRWSMLIGLFVVAAGALLVARLTGREWRFGAQTNSHRGVSTGANAASDPRLAKAASPAADGPAQAAAPAAFHAEAATKPQPSGVAPDVFAANRNTPTPPSRSDGAQLSGNGLASAPPPSAAEPALDALDALDAKAVPAEPTLPIDPTAPGLPAALPVHSAVLPPTAASAPSRSAREHAQPHPPSAAAAPSPVAPSFEPPDPTPAAGALPSPEPEDAVMVVKEEATSPPTAAAAPEADPAKVRQLTQSATAALMRGEVGRAIELSRQATDLDPNNALAWRSLGLAYERASDDRAARSAYQHYLDLVPNGAQSDMVRGRMQSLSGN
jgi:serine/threonine protein kinase